jgi:large subunit ribosomal protein L27e
VLTPLLQKEPKKEAKRTIRKLFEERHSAGKNQWFFQQLRF